MSVYTVFLFRSGRVYVRDGAHVAPDAIQPPVLTSTVEAQTEYAALGKVMLQLHDAANQPYQHVCAPCDKPHVADTMISQPMYCAHCNQTLAYCECGEAT